MKVAIIGAGPTGLGAAWRLQELGHKDWVLLESSPGPGGLASSQQDEFGFWWDIGVHALHSHFPYFDDVMTIVVPEWIKHQRNSQAFMRGGWVPYPVQYNVHLLPPDERWRCVRDMFITSMNDNIDAAKGDMSRKRRDNFAKYLRNSFGEGLYEAFLRPYNEKVWATSLDQMGCSWMGERVPGVDFAKVLQKLCCATDLDDGWGPNSEFMYPAKRGNGSIWWTMFTNHLWADHVVFNHTVAGIYLKAKKLRAMHRTRGPVVFDYDVLINTAPLDKFGGMCVDRNLGPCDLRKTTTHVVGLGFKGSPPADLADKNWMYFPESQFPFYRAATLSSFAPGMAPQGHWSLLCETASTPDFKPYAEKVPYTLADECIAALARARMVDPESVVVKNYSRHEYGYPVPTLDRDCIVKQCSGALEKYGVFSRGRFGHWKYEVSNQDHSFMQGVEVIDRVLNGKEETVAKL